MEIQKKKYIYKKKIFNICKNIGNTIFIKINVRDYLWVVECWTSV